MNCFDRTWGFCKEPFSFFINTGASDLPCKMTYIRNSFNDKMGFIEFHFELL